MIRGRFEVQSSIFHAEGYFLVRLLSLKYIRILTIQHGKSNLESVATN